MPKLDNLYQFDAIGTHWSIEILDDEQFSSKLIGSLNNYTRDFTNNYSRFIDSSLLNQLCENQVLITPPLEMIEMMKFAQKLHHVSEGVFDITVGGELHRAGYGKRDKANPIMQDFWVNTIISRHKIVVPKNVTLDFGGFGKGWLIDQYSRILVDNGINNFIVNGGGDLYVQNLEPIEFFLENPTDQKYAIGSINIKKGALAVSSSLKRSWVHQHQNYHHLIDPRSAQSVNSQVSATFVQAKSALIADSLATILFIEPSLEKSLKKHFDFNAMILNSKNQNSR